MKVLARQEFNEKLKNISDKSFKMKLLKFVDFLSEIKDFSEIKQKFELSVSDVFVHKIDDYRLFFSSNKGGHDGDIILIDLLKKETIMPMGRFKNPKINNLLNPKYNNSINPKYNSSINPKYNSSINPKFNSSINPRYNNSINPKYNHSINPKYNNSINPKYNHSINPKYNNSINPEINPTFEGYFIFDLNSKITSFAITANENILIIYDNSFDFLAYAVRLPKGFVIFDVKSNEVLSYIISDGATGFNEFDLEGNWIGYLK